MESTSDPFFANGGEGRVRGMEVMIRHNPIGNFFGWISYTLSSAERYAVPFPCTWSTHAMVNLQ